MAISQSQKVDFLYKKLGFTKTKTGLSVDGTLSGTKKAGFGEVFASPLVIADGSVWNQSELIPATPPGSDSTIVKGYRVATALRMTVDPTTAGRRSYIAYTTFNNTSSARLTNWIDTQFGNDYVVKVYAGDPNSGGTLLPAGGSTGSDSWFFDYSAGILQFHDTSIHSSIDSNGTNVYIVGYRYIGQTGVISIGDDTNFGDLTVNNNFRVVGLSTFVDAVNLSNNLSVAGITTLAGLSTVTGHTLFTRQLSVSGVSTFNDDVTFYGANAGRNVVWDKSDNRLEFAQDAIASFGNSADLEILNSGSRSQIRQTSGQDLYIQHTAGRDIFYEARNHYFRNQTDSNELQAEFLANGAANLYHDGGIRFETTGIGVSVLAGTGNTATIAGPQFLILDPDGVGVNTGVVRIKGDLIVEGEQTIIKSTELEIADFIVGIASTATTDALADGAGFKIGPNNTLLYEHNSGTNPSLKSSENINVATGKVYQIAETERLSASKLSLGTGTTIHAVGTNILSFGTGVAERVRISDDGINVVGIATFASSIDANSNLDVAGISTFQGLIDANGLIEATAGENKIPSLYNAFSNLPAAGDYHGMFAHVHATQKGYFAHGGAWYELVNRKLDGTVGTGTDSYNVGVITATQGDIGNGGLDVDGHTELDNLGVSGVGTFASSIHVADSIIHQGDTDTSVDFTDNKINLKTANATRVSVATTAIVLSDEVKIQGNHIVTMEGDFTATDNIHIKNNTSGGNFQIGIRQNDTDGNHHRAYIKASKGTGAISGKLELLVRGSGGGTNRGFILDAGVGIQANQQILPETDSTYNLGTDAKRWTNIYTDDLNVAGVSTFTGAIDANGNLDVDGYTELDDLNVSGVSTFSGAIDANGSLDVDGLTNLDDVIISGVTTTSNHILPDTNGTSVDLGASNKHFRNLYVSNLVTAPGGPGIIGPDLTIRNINATGIVTVAGSTDLNGNLDVDGYAELDDLNVSGVTTTVQLKVGTAGQTLVGITTILDEDNMASNSAAALATQQSIKAYVDNSSPGGSALAVSADSGSNESINLSSEVLDIEGTSNEIETATGTNKVVIGLPDDVTIGRDLTVTRNLSATGNLTVGAGGTVITTVVGAAASIGIGDASPSYMLDVAGAINSQTDVKVNGVSVSDQALNDAVAMAIALG